MNNEEKTVLQLRFTGSDEKVHTFSFPKAVSGLTSETIAEAMNTIATLDLFHRKGVTLYVTAVSGAYVKTTTQELYTV
ncbi:DUF2922 domain-containing protein [Secundilactobacillus mixtipabuli]|uniref:DUF2922 domain-containing protein n=1 Tax=Secundilactobacillus mixtipabuli TaxID=1435342 RepID=A0A1Z5I9K0_9LACO|nr:DUF2922 domain-containing protein [Secundilactobacillus mixtipabuli]GAW98220.1 hypothetical protein IWT30_00163 [Secundilactobacillus mixtipabuli]